MLDKVQSLWFLLCHWVSSHLAVSPCPCAFIVIRVVSSQPLALGSHPDLSLQLPLHLRPKLPGFNVFLSSFWVLCVYLDSIHTFKGVFMSLNPLLRGRKFISSYFICPNFDAIIQFNSHISSSKIFWIFQNTKRVKKFCGKHELTHTNFVCSEYE